MGSYQILVILAIGFKSALALAETAPDACQAAYDRLYSKDTINITHVIGEMSEGKESKDFMLRSELVDNLTAPCKDGDNFCGFARTDDADVFLKSMMGRDGKQKTIRFRIQNSTVDSKIIDYKSEAQKLHSRRTLDTFKAALSSDQIVIYHGHANYGEGPQFGTTTLSDMELMESISKAENKPDIIGLIVCDGEGYYGKKLHKAAPNAGLILTRQRTSIDDGVAAVRATYDALLGRKCEEHFEKAYRKSTEWYYLNLREYITGYDLKNKTPRFSNFFKPIGNDENYFPKPYVPAEMHESGEPPFHLYRPGGTAQ